VWGGSETLIDHPKGYVPFDTGIAEGHAATEELYRPVRRSRATRRWL